MSPAPARRAHFATSAAGATTVPVEVDVPHVVVTVAVNCAVPPGASWTFCGDTATARILSATATGTTALLDGSALLVATTCQVPASGGSVYTPAVEIVPPAAPSCTLQVTDLSVAPVTLAVNAIVVHASPAAGEGVTLTATGGGAAVTVTVAVSERAPSARLVATTVQVAATAGAVYTPAVVIVPQPAPGTDQVTEVSAAFVTVAVNATVPPAATDAVRGETATATGGGGATTVTVPWPLTPGTARLVARTWKTPGVVGAE